jgi:DNA (cytosine-5)-methyltransferase 1
MADAGLADDKPLQGLRFLDVFAGIGGFHIALSNLGATCAGAIELDAEARKTYRANHAGSYPLHDDIRTASQRQFGQVDNACGGFPCQSFSMAGNRAGFEEASKGAPFFEIARLIGALSPSIAILENVKGLCSHDDGRTFETVLDTLTGLGYSVSNTSSTRAHSDCLRCGSGYSSSDFMIES